MSEDSRWMLRALELAGRAQGRTAPNPMVGAIIVQSGRILAEGWHRAPGQAHAEADALQHVGGRADGATMYVNVEPCCHYGRTPPCTDAVLASGVRRIVIGTVDPDPRVSGRGIAILQARGLDVVVGVEEAACRALNAPYLTAAAKGRPFVTLKAGLTLDGRIAAADGQSRWITGPDARQAAHRLRDTHDAVLIGAGTLLADDPALNTRIDGGRDALPVVLDGNLVCPPAARVLTAGRRPLIFCAQDAPPREDLAADLVRLPQLAPHQLDLSAVLAALLARGVHSVLVEGGGQVHRSFLDAGLVNRVELFLAPRVLAGGPGWVGGAPYRLDRAPQLRFVGARPVGADLWVSLEPAQGEA